MANQLRLSSELSETVERARAAAEESGELLVPPYAPPASPLPPEAKAALADWVASGDYDRVVAELTADDPDLASQ